jgi:CRP/FNR family transcriptional regulator
MVVSATGLLPPSLGTACASGNTCGAICADCAVRMVAACAALDERNIGALERIAHTMRLAPRQHLFMAGDEARHVHIVTSGFLRLQRDLADGRRQIVGFAVPGDFIGLALEDRYGFSVDALTGASLCRFDRGSFTDVAHDRTDLLSRLHQIASHELALAQEHMVLLGRRRADERVAVFLLNWRARMGRLVGRSATTELPMGRQDMADHLGLTIETVSRILSRWTRDRILLDVPGGLRFLDEERLRAVVSADAQDPAPPGSRTGRAG